jgi:hypothetical protein
MTSHANNATHMKIIVPAIWQWMSRIIKAHKSLLFSILFLYARMDRWIDGGGRTTNECETKEEQLRPQLSRE